MAVPVVAIVGRPNVGKSSLLNWLSRSHASIVDPTAGVTRDRVSRICALDDLYVELMDTGGHGIVDRDDLSADVEQQIQRAIELADVILFVVDAREGLAPLDQNTAEMLRRHAARVRLVANKVDDPRLEGGLGEFQRLGFGSPLPVSAQHRSGRHELQELIRSVLGETASERPPDPVMRIAMVGKRNAGKSTLVNALAGEERVIVSEIPGTTRDSVDVRIVKDGRTLMVIDTAGLRKKNKLADDVEFYSYSRALAAIRRADVVLFLIDSTVPVGQVDKKLAHSIVAEFRPCVLVVNKWDLAQDRSDTDTYGDYLTKMLPEIDYAPVVFTSANEGRNVGAAVDLATVLFKQYQTRVGTGPLNQALREALATNAPRSRGGRHAPRVLYATQVSTGPPMIVLFVNDPGRFSESYHRFLLNRLRERLPFEEIPIRLVLRSRRASRGAVDRMGLTSGAPSRGAAPRDAGR